MYRCTQKIQECHYCGRPFKDGEDYWKNSRNNCYCMDNLCGWEDEDGLKEKLL